MSSLSPLSSRTPPVSTMSTRVAVISSTPPAVKGIFKTAFKIDISNPNLGHVGGCGDIFQSTEPLLSFTEAKNETDGSLL